MSVTDCKDCDPAGPTCHRCVALLEQEAEIDKLLTERQADRVAVIALVDALPRCVDCARPATWECGDQYDTLLACDEHVGSPKWRLEHADALVAFQARIAAWLGEAPSSAVEPPRKAIDLSTDEGWDRAAAGDPIYVTGDESEGRAP